MSAFFDAAFGFPAIIFTILLVPVILYWLLVIVGVADIDLFEADADLDVDVGLDTDAGVEADAAGDAAGDGGGEGLLASSWQALGLASMPITVGVSLVVVFGWFVALLVTGAVNALDPTSLVRLVAGVAAIVLAFLVGAGGAAVAGRPLSRLFVTTHAEQRSDYVGRICVIRTEKVTDSFGQAEAADPSGATVLLPVRTLPVDATSARPRQAEVGTGSELHYGDSALIVDYDREAEVFLVCPLDGELDGKWAGDVGGDIIADPRSPS